MKIGSLFTGYGGLDMAVEKFFHANTVWVSDIDPGASKILAHHWPNVPNLDDITTIDWRHVEPVDIFAGGWPCQPFSQAGLRKGKDDERALWPYVARAIRTLRPPYVVLENVTAITTAGELARATSDLATLGYVGSWRSLRATDIGAPHLRARTFILATNTHSIRWRPRPPINGQLARKHPPAEQHRHSTTATNWGIYEPAIRRWESQLGRPAPTPHLNGRVTPRFNEWMMGLPEGWVTAVPGLTRPGQLKALGNGVVPQQALVALQLMSTLTDSVPT